MLVISSRISGWRVTDSITLPKMIPIPTPAPTAPRPPPMPIPRPAPTPEEEEHGERKDERNRDVRGGGIQRERRYVSTEDVDLLLGVGGQWQVADDVAEPDEQEQRAAEWKPFGGQRVVHVAPGDVLAHER